MTLFHWLMALVWLLSNRITTIDDYTADYKIFKRCHYPISKNLRYKKYINLKNY